MRTAIVLLALLALASIPGSVIPQRNIASSPLAVAQFIDEHPDLSPWLERLYLFNVYGSPWFAAIYLLLLASMIGCVVPRSVRLFKETLAPPPPAPRHLDREPAHRVVAVPGGSATALQDAALILRRRRFRVRVHGTEVAAEKGYLREVGNVVFHLSLLGLLLGIAAGRLYGFEGRVALAEGDSFTNVRGQYDVFTPSVWTDIDNLEPLSFRLDSFTAEFEVAAEKRGEPRDFDARLTYDSGDGPDAVQVRPNEPLDVNATKFFLTGHGYAPRVTVRDGSGAVTFSGPVIFLPADPNFTSDGVIKAPDAVPTGLAFEGLFLPTFAETGGGPVSAFPGLLDPRLVLSALAGDLGLNDGSPQSVYSLDKTGLEPVLGPDGAPLRQPLAVGETLRLPGDAGSITFDGVSRFANFQIAYDPGKEISLVAALLLLAGLTTSLLVRRRRIWVKVLQTEDGRGGAVVELAQRSLGRREPPMADLEAVAAALRGPDAPDNSDRPDRVPPATTSQE